jgi:micrococcal nuclease
VGIAASQQVREADVDRSFYRGGNRMRFILTALAAIALALPASAAASVHLAKVTSPVGAGSTATLTVSVTRPASCSITVNYKSGPSHAAGLYPKQSNAGRVSWTWKVGTRTTPGRWTIDIYCGSAGSLHTSFVTR